MSQYFLLGGFIGFAVVFFLSFSAGASIHVALRNGMIGCIVLSLLVKYLCGRITAAIVTTKLKELEAAEKAKEEETHEQTVKN